MSPSAFVFLVGPQLVLSKEDIGWDLVELEEAARLVAMEEREECGTVSREGSGDNTLPEEGGGSGTPTDEEGGANSLPKAEDGAGTQTREGGTIALPGEKGGSDQLPEEQGGSDKLPEEEGGSDTLPGEESRSDVLPEEEGVARVLPEEESRTDTPAVTRVVFDSLQYGGPARTLNSADWSTSCDLSSSAGVKSLGHSLCDKKAHNSP